MRLGKSHLFTINLIRWRYGHSPTVLTPRSTAEVLNGTANPTNVPWTMHCRNQTRTLRYPRRSICMNFIQFPDEQEKKTVKLALTPNEETRHALTHRDGRIEDSFELRRKKFLTIFENWTLNFKPSKPTLVAVLLPCPSCNILIKCW